MGFANNFKASPLYSMRTELLASSQSCCTIDADAWYKQVLELKNKVVPKWLQGPFTLSQHQCNIVMTLVMSVLIEGNGVTSDWVCDPFLSYYIVFKENRMASIMAQLTQH